MTFAKTSIALALAGAVTLAAATPTLARDGRYLGAAGAGFVAGAVIGGAAANSRAYYGPGYGPGYGAYAYAPGYDAYASDDGAYVSQPFYGRSGQFGNYSAGYAPCATDGNYNKTDYGAC